MIENGNQVKVSKNKEKKQSFAKVAYERLGQSVLQNCNELAFIVEYVDARNITVQFKTTNELVKTDYGTFVKGNVKSHFTPSVFGVGIKGTEPTVDENGELLNSYKCWSSMLNRCYSAKFQEKHPTYIDCRVCEEWLYYPNFKKWYEANYYDINSKKSQLDKDILIKGNKMYSPDTCVFVPNFINTLFIKCQNSRGELPIGVIYDKTNKKYQARLRVFKDGKKVRKGLGRFDTPEEAFEAYKQAKEAYIKEIADNYKDKIPAKLYEAMYSYRVEIDD